MTLRLRVLPQPTLRLKITPPGQIRARMLPRYPSAIFAGPGIDVDYENGNITISADDAVGDVSGPASSTAGHVAIFADNTGKLIADGGKGLPNGQIVGDTDTQTLTNKTINGANNTITNINGTSIRMGGDARGDLLQFDGTNYVRLPPGVVGQVLQTQGPGALNMWAAGGGGGGGTTLIIADTAPATSNPSGSMWWNSANGQLYVLYDDGTSKQWVVAAATPISYDGMVRYDAAQTLTTPQQTQARTNINAATRADVVRYDAAQALTTPQQAQARSNIAAVALADVVRYDAAQTLTLAQQEQARKNIYAARVDAHGWQNILVNPSFEIMQQFAFNGAIACADGTTTYAADQWIFVAAGGVPFTVTPQSYQVPGALGISRMLNIVCNGNSPMGSGANTQIYQAIEGQRAARLNWGTAGGTPLTVCMLIYGAIAGTAVLAVRNSAGTRSYLAPITITTPGVYEYKIVTIPPDKINATAWYNDNRAAMYISLGMGVGTGLQTSTPNTWLDGNFLGLSGNTNFFATTGNAFRVAAFGAFCGSQGPTIDSEFANSLRDFPVEQTLCKRYWQKIGGTAAADILMRGYASGPGDIVAATFMLPVEMRASPTPTERGTWSKVNAGGSLNLFAGRTSLGVQYPGGVAGATAYYTTDTTCFIELSARL